MTIRIKPETGRLVREEISNGHFSAVNDPIVQGVLAWRRQRQEPAIHSRRSSREAIARTRQLRQGVTLGGLKVRDLIGEGRRF